MNEKLYGIEFDNVDIDVADDARWGDGGDDAKIYCNITSGSDMNNDNGKVF